MFKMSPIFPTFTVTKTLVTESSNGTGLFWSFFGSSLECLAEILSYRVKFCFFFVSIFPNFSGKYEIFGFIAIWRFFAVSWRPMQFLSTSQVNTTNDPAYELLGQKPPEKWGQRKEKLLPCLSYHIW